MTAGYVALIAIWIGMYLLYKWLSTMKVDENSYGEYVSTEAIPPNIKSRYIVVWAVVRLGKNFQDGWFVYDQEAKKLVEVAKCFKKKSLHYTNKIATALNDCYDNEYYNQTVGDFVGQ